MNTKEELKKLRKEARILRQQNATYKRGSEIHKQNSQEKDQIIKEQKEVIEKKDNKIDQAKKVGAKVAEKAKEAGIETVVFDRSGYLYHGRIKALADAAREGGLKF